MPATACFHRAAMQIERNTNENMTDRTGVRTILIAEDNPVVREVLRGIIRHDRRFSVIGEATNGQTALELVASLKPDLVCLDVLMPGLDGLSVLRTMHDEFPDTRVVLVTGQSTSEVVSEALALGASGFVVKPFNAEKLLRALHAALGMPAENVK
jgi:two-component system chemotaxis response regulator CheY